MENRELISYRPVAGTPFTIVQYEGYYYIMMGKYRLNETPFKEAEEVEKWIEEEEMNIIMKMIAIVMEAHEE